MLEVPKVLVVLEVLVPRVLEVLVPRVLEVLVPRVLVPKYPAPRHLWH